jgi:SAM-dependent methyltransferase
LSLKRVVYNHVKSATFVIYTLAIGLSAFLLFLVQPMIAKLLLPVFGGGASIWITSLVFFQVMLLVGYGITHWLIKLVGIRRHMLFVVILLVSSLLLMPLGIASYPIALDAPAAHLLVLLFLSVGLPYLMLSTTSPTLQYWMAFDGEMRGVNPYVQYGVSNAGSLLGLLVYPFVVEPLFDNTMQTSVWSGLYIAYGVIVLFSLVRFMRSNGSLETPPVNGTMLKPIWFLQALIPSALLLVITHYLTLDVVNLPLLWIAPLAIYLITFVICFLFPRVSKPSQIRTGIAVLSLLMLMLTSRPELAFGLEWRVLAALVCLFCVCMVFHGDLERGKPHKQFLTAFYLVIASGGAAGSVLVGLLAPLVFKSTFEFSIVVLAALYYLILHLPGFTLRRLLLGFVGLVLVVGYVSHETDLDGQTINRARSFYGTYAVRDVDGVRRLVAGTHVHGEQYLDPENEHAHLAYYHDETGIARIFDLLPISRTALIGLGVGSLVEYGDASMSFDVFELDAEVVRLAKNYFTVLGDSPSSVRYFIGDGRIRLQEVGEQYDLIVMDAFTSGAIPMHLVTVEAMQEAFERLKPGGAVAYHISNHHVDLLPVLNAIAEAMGVGIRLHKSTSDESRHRYPAQWVLLTRNETLLNTVDQQKDWVVPGPEKILWRDDKSDIRSVLKF